VGGLAPAVIQRIQVDAREARVREDDVSQVHMSDSDCAPIRSDVVLDLLDALRADHYTLAGWARFSARSWHIARQTAAAHPRLARSWRRVAVGLTLAEAVALIAEARLGGASGRAAARRAAPGAALCLAYTLGDAYVHLGMNQATSGAPLYDTLGVPTILTLSRSAVAGLLTGHLIGHRAGRAPVSSGVLSLALASASVTDIADGQLARTMDRSTRLGAYLDAEADIAVALAMTLTLVARRALPGWLATALLARWLTPFAYALTTYFGQGSRVPIGSTRVGKVAGVAQMATLGMALLPERAQKRAPGLRGALHAILAALLVAAPLTQLAQARRAARGSHAHRLAHVRKEEMRRHGR